MFTGIIENIASIETVEKSENQIFIGIKSSLASSLKVDQSVAHNGVCLTVTKIDGDIYHVCAVQESMDKTTIPSWENGMPLNLERGMIAGSRLDGHIVQGHVDCVGIITSIHDKAGEWNMVVHFPDKFAALVVEKGSIVINGVSLTCFNLGRNHFEVTIIPFTLKHTTLSALKKGDEVNLEFDIIGKYILRSQSLEQLPRA